MKSVRLAVAILALASGARAAGPPIFPDPPLTVVTDTAPDAAFPAGMAAFQLPSHGALVNAVFYLAAGGGSHPTMLLLHGFPGNEQNLDLAQAARRAGWNVLTLHYRGSWGSEGSFSFAHAAEDAAAALAFLRMPDAMRKYRINTDRIVVVGHSMGGMLAARIAADDSGVAGTMLIDPWDIAATARSLANPAARQAFVEGELRGDLPPLAGTSEAALMEEIVHAPPALDLIATAAKLADRPLLSIGAARANAATARAAADAAIAAGGAWVQSATWPTDHSFSDMRIALAATLVDWLWTVPARAVSFTGPGWSDRNIFARIIRGELPTAKVYEDAHVLAFMDNHPESVGHVLVISKTARARNIMEIDQRDLDRVMAVARRVAIAERKALNPTGIVVQQNNGNASSVPHLHVHVYPAYNDVPSLSTTAREVPLAELEPVAAKIRAALP